MTESTVPNFLHLNSDGCWPAFQSCGLDRTADGAFRLAALPALAMPVLPPSLRPPKPAGSAGIAVARNGTVFFSDPDGHRVLMWNPVDAEPQPMPCLDETNADGTGLSQPRGLAIHPRRNALLVADAGNGRILLISLASLRLSEVWELPSEGQSAEPWSLAVDDAGSVYAIDHSTRSVRKFDLYGRECRRFRRRVDEGLAQSSPTQPGPQPSAVVFVSHNRPALYVLDTAGRALVVLDPRGNLLTRIDLQHVGEPAGLAVTGDGYDVGDNAIGRLLRLDNNGNVAGHAPDYEGWVAELASDGDGGLWLHPGGSGTVLRFSLPDRTAARASDPAAFVQRGFFWGGPFEAGESEVDWHRLRAAGPPLPANSQFQFYIFTANRRSVQPPAFGSAGAERAWKPLPRGGDVLVLERSRSLWIAGVLEGDGRVTPQIDQVRVEFDHETYSRHLPEIYRTGPERADLDRFLSLIESFFVDVQQELASLDRFFDADAVPADWLDWLAEWVALPPDEARPDEQTRRAIAGAFESYAWRGTRRGLLAALKRDAGVDARIDEPLAAAAWWALPAAEAGPRPHSANGLLGVTTRLIPAAPQGAVLGSSATLDASHLTADSQFGAPLFETTAHQFRVGVHRSQIADAERLELIRTIVDREKPAHTLGVVAIVEPGIRIGRQSVLGVDTVIGGGPPIPGRLGDESRLNAARLAEEHGTRIGSTGRIGITTRLGHTTP